MKLEMHAHTNEVSFCAHISAKDTVNLYKDNGYDGIVITNHYSRYFIDMMHDRSFDHLMDFYLNGFKLAQEEGDKIGLSVFLGLELCFDSSLPTDFLVYGLDEEFLRTHKFLNRMDLDSFLKILPDDALIYQAHPFRNSMHIIPPGKLFGIEVHNGNPRHDSRNDIAHAWADKFNMHKISGSDFHQTEDIGRGGLILNRTANNNNELIDILRSDDYTLIE